MSPLENPSPPEPSSAQVIHSQLLLEETSTTAAVDPLNGDAIQTESDLESTPISLQLSATEPSVTEESEQPVVALVSAIESLEIHTEEMIEDQESVVALEEPPNQAIVAAIVEAVAEPVVIAEDALDEKAAPASEEPCADVVDAPASEEPSADVVDGPASEEPSADVPASEDPSADVPMPTAEVPCADVPMPTAEVPCADVPVLASEEPCAEVVAVPASEEPCADAVPASEEPVVEVVAVPASEEPCADAVDGKASDAPEPAVDSLMESS